MQVSPAPRPLLLKQSDLPFPASSACVLRRTLAAAGLALLILPGQTARAAQSTDLTQESLEDLMNVHVTSVSKREETTSQAAAAVFVISRQDIQRSGALNIPDLLRMVPGLDVAQINTNSWAITARGFNGEHSNKLLVLVDGRAVYNPIFAGVFWDSQNIPIETVERIEVIRGPGAAIWGSNAVNGVINIITRSADDTQGGYISGGAGNTITGPAEVRYGGKARGLGSYRLYAEGFEANASATVTGISGQDDWRLIHGGFRTDSNLSAKDSLTAEGEGHSGNGGELATVPLSLSPPVTATVALRDYSSGWNVLGRWNHVVSPRSDTSLQVYFERTDRDDSTYNLGLNTFGIDLQHHRLWGTRQDIVTGIGYRLTSDDSSPTLRIVFTPVSRHTQLFNWFVQDEIAILRDRLRLSLGVRLEHNDFTGFVFQPTARLAWRVDSKDMVWSAISVADRTPARSDTALRVNFAAVPGPGNLPMLISLFGDANKKNERLAAIEAGYRGAWTNSFSLDATAFYNRYNDLTSVEPGAISLEASPTPVHWVLPSFQSNGLYGETHGLEFFANWKAASFWTLSPGYSFFSMHLHPFAGSQDFTGAAQTEGGTPDHQAQIRSSVSLPRNLQWNVSAYFVNRLPAVSIPSYTRLDTGLIWRAGERFTVSVAGQNLLKNLHPEFSGTDTTALPGMVRRGAYAKAEWSF
jgi:iron complex outermembrane receptor protein